VILGIKREVDTAVGGPVPGMKITLAAGFVGTFKRDLDVAYVVVSSTIGSDQRGNQGFNIGPTHSPDAIIGERNTSVLSKYLDLLVDAVQVDPSCVPMQAVGYRLAIYYLLEHVIIHGLFRLVVWPKREVSIFDSQERTIGYVGENMNEGWFIINWGRGKIYNFYAETD
jgi:hypothetical protein